MNHRALFFLSITVIAVGVFGILIQHYQTPTVRAEKTVSTPQKTVITIAEATRALKPYEILSSQDYKIRTVEVQSGVNDIRDLSSFSSLSLNGYLVRNNIAEGSAIIPSLIEAPSSKSFIMHSLRGNELPFGYMVKPRDEYLLSSLNVGDKVSLFIRVAEIERGKKSDMSSVPEGNGSSESVMKKYALSPILGDLTILDVQRDKRKEDKVYSDTDSPVGKIVLRMNQQQLAKIRVVEKSGEIIIFPAEGVQGNNKKIEMDEVWPQFRVIKELRGGK